MAKKSSAEDSPQFEEAVAELEKIVKRLEQGGNSLVEDLTDYGRAIKLIKQCHKRLSEAERTVRLLTGIDADGNPISVEFDQSERSEQPLEQKQSDRSRRRSAGQEDSLF